jgi:hypothetical protein
MIEKVASQFANMEYLSEVLESNNDLKVLTMEFCHTFDVKAIAYDNSSKKINVLSKRGIPLGELLIKHKDGDPIYVYRCDGIITKEKASANSDSNSRDSNKITSLIKTIKKNSESPDESKIFDSYKGAIRDAFNNVNEKRKPQISCSSDEALGMIEYILKVPTTTPFNIDDVQNTYHKYLKGLGELDNGKKTLERYSKGCIVVKMPYRYSSINQANDGLLIGEATFDTYRSMPNDITFTKPLERYNSISDSPIAGVASMIRTYFQSNKNYYDEENALGIMVRDRFYPDIDVSMASRNSALVTLIPLHAE